MWPSSVKEQVLVACGRCCCLCHRFCGTNIELHHIIAGAEGGASTVENCIALCFDCHADVGHYNPSHPKGTAYSARELRRHRDRWFRVMAALRAEERTDAEVRREVLEMQAVSLQGFVWRETFPGRPNYHSIHEGDEPETCYVLVLPHPITLIASSLEDETSYEVQVKRIHLSGRSRRLQAFLLAHARVDGKLFAAHTGHHHGDAVMEVTSVRLVRRPPTLRFGAA